MRGGSLLRPGATESQIVISLSGREYVATRARLGGFVHLQQARKRMLEASARGENGVIADALALWMNVAAGVDRETFETTDWLQIAVAMGRLEVLNELTEDLPILRSRGGRPPRWDYDGREAIAWADLLAHAYGWTLDDIIDLYPEEAVALSQEIAAREYYEHRFQHALSQVAYNVDRSGRATYQPLDMPYWMYLGEPKKVKIPKAVLPIGNIIFPGRAPKELVH